MEKLYHYLWKYRMFGRPLRLTTGESVTILDPGLHNNDAGPDFFNSKLKIENQEWAGNVEIHIKSSDWYRHGHHLDSSYDSVVLHAVGIADGNVSRTDGTVIPQMEMTMPASFFHTVGSLLSDMDGVRCGTRLSSVAPLTLTDWLETLAIERIQSKGTRLYEVYQASGCDWEQASFIFLARALGFGLNSDPFEMLARTLPLKYIKRHADNILQIEALLFGQAGMLDTSIHIFDEYYQLLCREYFFLARKYGLRPLRNDIWKYARTRPQNFPHRRIAFLAKMVHEGVSFPSSLLDNRNDMEQLRNLFRFDLEGYWLSHSDFDLEARFSSSRLSEASIDLLLINFVAPLFYTFGSSRGDCELAEKALDILSSLQPEKNTVIRMWTGYGLECRDAMRSQALLHLRKEYCDRRKCLDCRIGHSLMRRF